MTYDELKEHVMNYFGDTSRSPYDTEQGLRDLADEIELLLDALSTRYEGS